MAERKITGWFTMNGNHIPIYEGETTRDAMNRAVAKMNEDKKNEQIKKNKEQADKLNGKRSEQDDKKNIAEGLKSPTYPYEDLSLTKSEKEAIDKMTLEDLRKWLNTRVKNNSIADFAFRSEYNSADKLGRGAVIYGDYVYNTLFEDLPDDEWKEAYNNAKNTPVRDIKGFKASVNDLIAFNKWFRKKNEEAAKKYAMSANMGA